MNSRIDEETRDSILNEAKSESQKLPPSTILRNSSFVQTHKNMFGDTTQIALRLLGLNRIQQITRDSVEKGIQLNPKVFLV